MQIGVLQEPSWENRVAFLPEHIADLKKRGFSIQVESSAGQRSFASDEQYLDAGAQIGTRKQILSESHIICCMHPSDDLLELNSDKTKVVIGMFQPFSHSTWLKSISAKMVTVFSLDMLPRTTRAQAMDVLSSQANIAGYKAVLLAANLLPHYFPMFMTAAGSIRPAKVLILGAGVAGLQAIATARRLGAVVEVFDTRAAVKEEVMSLGAKFVEVEGAADASSAGGYAVEQTEEFLSRQREKIHETAIKSDIIITTAQIPGRKAPILIEERTLQQMKSGSVVIDLAAISGGNTPHTPQNGKVVFEGVIIVGNSWLPSDMPSDASKLYGKNMTNFLSLFKVDQNDLVFDLQDELLNGSCICREGSIVHEKLKQHG
jgi:NAD(P) transhydrogenase subunit alpha